MRDSPARGYEVPPRDGQCSRSENQSLSVGHDLNPAQSTTGRRPFAWRSPLPPPFRIPGRECPAKRRHRRNPPPALHRQCVASSVLHWSFARFHHTVHVLTRRSHSTRNCTEASPIVRLRCCLRSGTVYLRRRKDLPLLLFSRKADR